MPQPPDLPPPVSPRAAGIGSLTLALLAAAAVLFAATGLDQVGPRGAKKAVLIAVPLSLVAAFLGLVGWQSVLGKFGTMASAVLLLSAAAFFAYTSFAR